MSIPKLLDLLELEVKKPKRIGAVVVVSEGQVLLVKRAENAGKYPNFWAVPMGHVEDGEKMIQGAHREFHSLVYLDTLKDSKYNRMVGLYKIELPNKPKPQIDHEHSDWGYFDTDALPHPIEDNLRYTLELKI
jgi:hypothetical protein